MCTYTLTLTHMDTNRHIPSLDTLRGVLTSRTPLAGVTGVRTPRATGKTTPVAAAFSGGDG